MRLRGKALARCILGAAAISAIVGTTPAAASGTGQFHVGAFWQPPAKPTDYNTNANWADIAAANIDSVIGLDGGIASYNKADNATGIAYSKANNVKLFVTDSSIYGFKTYSAADQSALQTALGPYKSDPDVGAISLRDEPSGLELEGVANTYRTAKAFAPRLDYYVNLFPIATDRAYGDMLHNPAGRLALSNSQADGDGSFVKSTNPLGQSFTVPAGTSYIHGIQLYLDASQWSPSETLTLKLWDSPAKTTLLAQASLTGPASVSPNDGHNYPYFELDRAVTPGSAYYWELVHNGGGDNSVGWVIHSTTDTYAGGQAYENNAAKPNDFWFRLFTSRPNTPDLRVNEALTGDNVSNTSRLGQTFTTPANVNRRLYYIQPYIDATTWTSGQALTLTLWDSPAKSRAIASGTLTATNNGNYPLFYLFAKVASNQSYYWELTSNSASPVGWVVSSSTDVYSGGTAYKNGAAIPGMDEWFNLRFGSEYENYLDDWLTMSGADFILYDHYPFLATSDSPTYYQNMEIVRERGLDHDVVYGAFLQSVGIYRTAGGPSDVLLRAPNLNEKRYNVYSYLTYGFKNMYWFTYWRPQANGGGETFYGAPVDYNGTKTAAYNEIKTLSGEMQMLGNTLKNLTSAAVYHSGSSIPIGTSPIPNDYYVKPTDASQPIIEGAFTNASGRKYVMLTNRDYLNSRSISFAFQPKPASLTEISKTTGLETSVSAYNAATGTLTITLQPGEGRLFALPAGY